MTTFDIHRHRAAKMLAYLRTSADEIRAKLSVQMLTSHGYIVTRDGGAMKVDNLEDGTVSATMCEPIHATRFTKDNAQTLVAAFAAESEGEWRAEYWRDVAARDLDLLGDMIASIEARTA